MSTPQERHRTAQAAVTASALALLGRFERVDAALTTALTALRGSFPTDTPPTRRRRAAAFAASATAALDQVDAGTGQAVSLAVRGVVDAVTLTVLSDLGRVLSVRREVADAAVRDLAVDLRAATSYLAATARALARSVGRVADTPAERAGKTLERELRDRGLTAVVYKDGSRHGLAEYAEMAARTKLAETWQLASLDLFRQAGVTWVQITDGRSCGWLSHTDPDLANGKIVTVDEAEAHPLAHPRCVRDSFPRPDLRSEDDARRVGPIGVGTVPDQRGPIPPAVRTSSGRLDTRALAVVAPAAARHAQALARVQAGNVAAMGARPSVHVGVARATLRTARPPAPGPGGTP